MEGAVRESLRLFDVLRGDEAATLAWRRSERASLHTSFLACDMQKTLTLRDDLSQSIVARVFLDGLRTGKPLHEIASVFGEAGKPDAQMIARLEAMARSEPLDMRMRVYYGIGTLLDDTQEWAEEKERLKALSFAELQAAVMDASLSCRLPCDGARIQKDEARVALPLRVNFGGTWSDAPPYCFERGGTMLNAAITVNGVLPARAAMRRLDEPVIILESADIGLRSVFDAIEPMRDHSNPFDPFALHKAALLACGVIPLTGRESLQEVLERIGGGFSLSTEMVGIPRGSGLGTSSILVGACIQAILSFFGVDVDIKEQYAQVLCAEQIMSTGGGWQDQIGGMTPGLKYTTTRPGMPQTFCVEQMTLTPQTAQELNDRLVLIYTGQRRLARNLLRDIMGSYMNAEPKTVQALHRIQRLAVLMKYELERDNVDEFAQLLDEHWPLSKQLDAKSTNTCIEQIFASCEHLLAGKMICGAGGGGFLSAILKKGVSKAQLQSALYEVFGESGVAVWDCALLL
jgi:fucokinase